MTPEKTKSEKLFETTEIYNSPFMILSIDETHKIIMGNEIISKDFDSVEECLEYYESKPYNLILNACSVLSNHLINLHIEKQNNRIKKPSKQIK